MADHRDRRNRPNLPQPLRQEFEGDTPINDLELARMVKRAADDSAKALTDIATVSKSLDTDRKTVEKISSKLDTIEGHVTGLRVESAATSASVARLIVSVETNQAARLRVATAAEEASISDRADRKKQIRAIGVKILVGTSPLLAALGTYLLTRC